MAKKIELVVDVTAGEASSELDKLQGQTEDLAKSAKDIGPAYKKAGEEAEKSLLKISEAAEEANVRAESLKKVTEGLVGGFQAAQGSLALFGTEAEAVQKAFEKASAAFLITDGLKKVTEGLGQMRLAFDTLKTTLLANPVFLIAGAITAAVAGLALLTAKTDKYTEAVEKNNKELEDQQKYIEKRSKLTSAAYDAEIKSLQAIGKDTTELERKKIESAIRAATAQIKAIQLARKEEKKAFDEQFKEVEQINLLKGVQNKFKEKFREQDRKREEDEQEALIELANLQGDLALFEKGVQDKKAADYEKYLDDRLAKTKAADELLNKTLVAERSKQIQNDPLVRELKTLPNIILDEVADPTLTAWEELLGRMNMLTTDFIKFQQSEIGQGIQTSVDLAADSLSKYDALLQMSTQNQLAAAEGNEAQQEKIRERAFKREKALRIAQATIDTYKGATNAFATTPVPFNFAAAAAALAFGIAQVAQIAKQQYQAGGGGGGASSAGSIGSAINIPNFANQPINNSTDVNANAVDQGQGNISQPKPQMVYVLQGDIQQANNQYDSIANKATIQ